MIPSTKQEEFLRAVHLRFATPAGRYIIEHGEWFRAGPCPTDGRVLSPKACYRNAVLVASRRGLDYVEGFAALAGEPLLVVQHAWAVTSDGVVVDPTWDPPGRLYFGVRFSVSEVAGLMLEAWRWSLFRDGTVPEALARPGR